VRACVCVCARIQSVCARVCVSMEGGRGQGPGGFNQSWCVGNGWHCKSTTMMCVCVCVCMSLDDLALDVISTAAPSCSCRML